MAYAIVGVAGSLLNRGDGESWMSPMITALLRVILALVLLTSGESAALDRVALLGWIALIGGVVLIVLAWMARNRQSA